VNRSSRGNIKPSRGLRQGDPLSAYLFILCAKVLSLHLHLEKRSGRLGGVPTSVGGPRLNHLFFTDDSLLFCRAQVDEWQFLSNLLESYDRASG
jgi:hypothetical protein